MSDKQKVLELLDGAYDMHIHPAPSHFKRCIDDYELLLGADKLGMAGVMFKSHYDPTAPRAIIANKYAGAKKCKAYGSVALNWPVGGLNPYAADAALKMGAKIVWMPTRDTANCLQYGDMPGDFFSRPGIVIRDDEGKVKKEVFEILETVKKYDAFVATGHLYNDEIIEFCNIALDMGVKVILTHPDWERTKIPLEMQIELANKGVLVEKLWENIYSGYTTPEAMASSMTAIGYDKIFLGTDGGFGTFNPLDAIQDFVSALLDQGIPESGIKTMLCENAKQIIAGNCQ